MHWSKSYIPILANAALVFAACGCERQLPEPSSRSPIVVSVKADAVTRGYVEGSSMADIPGSGLHDGTLSSERPIYLTAWLVPQSGEPSEYFRNQEFSYNASSKTDGLWHHDPLLFWPIEGELSFLAYSCSEPFSDFNMRWSYGNSTNGMQLSVDESFTQDDLMFACALNVTNMGADDNPVELQFSHSQAWLQFKFQVAEEQFRNLVTVQRIVLKDVYTSGILNVNHLYGYAEGTWSFRFDSRKDKTFDDNGNLYGAYIPETPVYFDMLIPEQEIKTIVVYYTVGDTDEIFTYEYPSSGGTWIMGKKYVYEITVRPNLLTMDMSVADWTAADEVTGDDHNKWMWWESGR